MSDLDALLAGIVADPANAVRWLVMADWLEDHGFPERAELVRVHRELLRTCTDPDAHPERQQLHARMMELMRAGVQPCIPQKTLTLPGGVELRMSFIPPGSFLMGSPRAEANPEGEWQRDRDEILHLVTLTKGFWLGRTPVTQKEWVAVAGTNPCEIDWPWWPVETVNWDDTQSFCLKVRGLAGVEARLPTEAEWEYAARAGTTTPYYWGTELNGTQANCEGHYPYGTEVEGPHVDMPMNVEQYEDVSPHPWCLVDMIGNVWEWCADWYGSYPAGPVVDPVRTENGHSMRVCRGGSWNDSAWLCRAAFQNGHRPDRRLSSVGFRIAADLE